MKPFYATSLRYAGEYLEVLDQHLLPHQENWLRCDSADDLIAMIKKLQIRGAPMIGISASLLLAQLAEQGMAVDELITTAARLRAARPTAVNLMNNIDSMLSVMDQGTEAIVARAEQLFEEDQQLCLAMAEHGAKLLGNNCRLLTHCNTGSLATAGVGTAIGVIAQAHSQGKVQQVWVDETRPLLQGGRLTAWEMKRLGVPYKIITDSMAAILMRDGLVDAILVGADRIAANGDFANKVGTYNLAINAHFHNVPFYVVAPFTTIAPECASGDLIPIEERDGKEVRGVSGSFGDVIWAPEGSDVFNPAFDVTPAKLVTGWILDSGVYDADGIKDLIAELG
ncbi:MAG: S-methyl-5-thioribose-1-phosphate isomerase [Pontibacterium sp.]